MRLIDVEQFCKDNPNLGSAVYVALSKAPTIEAEPVRHGKLISTGYDEIYCEWGKCSKCGADNMMSNKRCCECGAKFSGRNDEE